jgi:hypothetical protein
MILAIPISITLPAIFCIALVIRIYPDDEGIRIQEVGVNNMLSVLDWVKTQQLGQGDNQKNSITLVRFIDLGQLHWSLSSRGGGPINL